MFNEIELCFDLKNVLSFFFVTFNFLSNDMHNFSFLINCVFDSRHDVLQFAK